MRHRIDLLNRVEEDIEKTRASANFEEADIVKWKSKEDTYRPRFNSKATRLLIREPQTMCTWAEDVWFKHATPKYSFFYWVVMQNKLSTGEKMLKWNANVDPIWTVLAKGILKEKFTTNWEDLIHLTQAASLTIVSRFVLRYTIQATIYGIWRKRNSRRHGEDPSPPVKLIKMIDKSVRNRLNSIKLQGDKDYEDGLLFWFDTRD
ncbi:uncharacterized protein LOC112084001 [Eutrema salsugineum]|uniref:uncharacterized protein LOC112084001 n=1 Tax=Eutrema salsugineum TaxID=72664 RepID=UPI000CED472C|nr:uncharacterized protein LOC112084001 [Eutrema salsugineum]